VPEKETEDQPQTEAPPKEEAPPTYEFTEEEKAERAKYSQELSVDRVGLLIAIRRDAEIRFDPEAVKQKRSEDQPSFDYNEVLQQASDFTGLEPDEYRKAAEFQGVPLDDMFREIGEKDRPVTEVLDEFKTQQALWSKSKKQRDVKVMGEEILMEGIHRTALGDKKVDPKNRTRILKRLIGSLDPKDRPPLVFDDGDEAENAVVRRGQPGFDALEARAQSLVDPKIAKDPERAKMISDLLREMGPRGTSAMLRSTIGEFGFRKAVANIATYDVNKAASDLGIQRGTKAYQQQMAKAWKNALYEATLFRAVGKFHHPGFISYDMIDPANLMGDPDDTKDALWITEAWDKAKNARIEVIGLDPKGVPVYRITHPTWHLFEMMDTVQAATVGALERISYGPDSESLLTAVREGSLEGIENRRDFLKAALSTETSDSGTLASVSMGFIGLGAAVLFPDLLMGAAGVARATKKVADSAADAAKFRRLAPLLEEELGKGAEALAKAEEVLGEGLANAIRSGDYDEAISLIDEAKALAGKSDDAMKATRNLDRNIASVVDETDSEIGEFFIRKRVPETTGVEGRRLSAFIPGGFGATMQNLHPSVRRVFLRGDSPDQLVPFYELLGARQTLESLQDSIRLLRTGDISTQFFLHSRKEANEATGQIRLLMADADVSMTSSRLTREERQLVVDFDQFLIKVSSTRLLRDDPQEWVRRVTALANRLPFDPEDIDAGSKFLRALSKQMKTSVAAVKAAEKTLKLEITVAQASEATAKAAKAVQANFEARAASMAFTREKVAAQAGRKVEPLLVPVTEKYKAIGRERLSPQALDFMEQIEEAAPLLRGDPALKIVRWLDQRARKWANKNDRAVREYYETRFAKVIKDRQTQAPPPSAAPPSPTPPPSAAPRVRGAFEGPVANAPKRKPLPKLKSTPSDAVSWGKPATAGDEAVGLSGQVIFDHLHAVEDGVEVAEFLLRHAELDSTRALIRRILPTLKKDPPKFHILSESGEFSGGFQPGVTGLYHPSTNIITIAGPEFARHGLTEEILTHELLHAATTKFISANPNHKAVKSYLSLNTEIAEALRRRVLANSDNLSEEAIRKQHDFIDERFSDPRELLTYSLTSPEFQRLLSTIELAPKQTAWNKFTRLIAGMFGIKSADETNALSQALRASEAVIGAAAKDVVPVKTAADLAPVIKPAGFPFADDGIEITTTFLDRAGRGGGMVVRKTSAFDSEVLRVSSVEVPESLRGQGHGVDLYIQTLVHAQKLKRGFLSDLNPSPDALRVYKSLEDLGVKFTRKPMKDVGGDLVDTYFIDARDLARIDFDDVIRQNSKRSAQQEPLFARAPKTGWARRAENGYEVSSKGDRRFSALYAKLQDGRTIESAYQAAKGTGKGKPALDPSFDYWGTYKGLWNQWADENPELLAELAEKSRGRVLTDQFASTQNNQARALSEILTERFLSKGDTQTLTTGVTRIISGGQTGADSGGLSAAVRLGLETGGTMPRGFRRERNPFSPSVARSLGLIEHSSASYKPRTTLNIQDSDGTLVLGNVNSSGSRLTINEANRLGKPVFVVPWKKGEPVPDIREFRSWLESNGIETLNVAGNRESVNPGIVDVVDEFLVRGLSDTADDVLYARHVSDFASDPVVVEFLEDGRAVIKAMSDAATAEDFIRVLGKVARRDLTPKDMAGLVTWLGAKGIRVSHEGAVFTADDAAVVQQAEAEFARAFQTYLESGRADKPEIEGAIRRVLEWTKDTYSSFRGTEAAGGASLDMDDNLRVMFDKLLREPSDREVLPNIAQMTKEALFAPKVGGTQVAVMDQIVDETHRLGYPISRENLDIQWRRAVEAHNAGRPEDAVIQLPGPVTFGGQYGVGKGEYTVAELITIQSKLENARLMDLEDVTKLPLGGAKGAIVERSASEMVDQFIVNNEKTSGSLGRVFRNMFLGGDAYADMRTLPPAVRDTIMSGVRRVQQSVGDAVTLVVEGDVPNLTRYLTGDKTVQFQKGGRSAISAGHDSVATVMNGLESYFNSVDQVQLSRVIDFIHLVQAEKTSARAMHNLSSINATQKEVVDAFNHVVNGDTASRFLIDAFQAAGFKGTRLEPKYFVQAEGDNIRGLLETFLYYANRTAKVDPADGKPKLYKTMMAESDIRVVSETTFTRMYQEISELFPEEQRVANRIAILIAGHGMANAAKMEWVKMGIAADAKLASAVKLYLTGERISDPADLVAVRDFVSNLGYRPQIVDGFDLAGVKMYLPQVARERLAMALAQAQDPAIVKAINGDFFTAAEDIVSAGTNSNAALSAALIYRYIKTRMVRGHFVLKSRYFWMNTFDHFNQTAQGLGYRTALISTSRMFTQNVLSNPLGQAAVFAARRAGKGEAVEEFRRVLQAGGDRTAEWAGKLTRGSKWHINVNDVIRGGDEIIMLGGKPYTNSQLRQTFLEAGIFASFDTSQLGTKIQNVGNLFLQEANKSKGLSKMGKDILGDIKGASEDIAEAWAERERVGLAITLMEGGIDPRTAAKLTIEVLYDYAGSMSKGDRNFLVNLFFPFWAFQKNANRQYFDAIFSPQGAYRLGVMRRTYDKGSDYLSQLVYAASVDENGIDTSALPPELRDTYFALKADVYDRYEVDGHVPAIVREELRLFVSGSSIAYKDGQVLQGTMLQEEIESISHRLTDEDGNRLVVDRRALAAFYIPRTDRSSLPTHYRNRIALRFPYTPDDVLDTYADPDIPAEFKDTMKTWMDAYRTRRPDAPYMSLFLPEPTYVAAWNHFTHITSAMILTLGEIENLGDKWFTDEDDGSDAISPYAPINALLHAERTPIVSDVAASLGVGGAQYPKRVSRTVAGWVDISNIDILELDERDDPFKVVMAHKAAVEAGEPTEDLPFLERTGDKGLLEPTTTRSNKVYYLMPGIGQASFTNSPLGELNDILLRAEKTDAEKSAKIRGELQRQIRFWTGLDMRDISRSRVASGEVWKAKKETSKLTQKKMMKKAKLK